MQSKFPLSMEHIPRIPRTRSFGCLSLRAGSVLTALLLILYTPVALSRCFATLFVFPELTTEDLETVVYFCFVCAMVVVHMTSFLLTGLMLVGALTDRSRLMRPWVVFKSVQLLAGLLLFILWTATSFVSRADDGSLHLYVVEFFCLILRLYMLMVVSSHCAELADSCEAERLLLHNNKLWTDNV